MKKRIYLDNAATTPLCKEALDAMLPYLNGTYGNPSSIHAEGRIARAAIERTRKTVADEIGASLGEVFFTSGGTESTNMVLKCAVHHGMYKRIITSPIEHHCVLHTAEHLQPAATLQLVNINSDGTANLEHLTELLQASNEPTLVSLMHVNNELGVINDIAAIGAICKEHGAAFHSDTVQSVGMLPINVSEMNIDYLTGAAHKFHGPKGVGFVFIKNECCLPSFIEGGAQERNMRGGTENVAGIVGLGAALQQTIETRDQTIQHLHSLRNRMIERLQSVIEGVRINGSDKADQQLPKVLSVSFPPSPKNDLLMFNLDIEGIAVSGGSACSSGVESKSHVMLGLYPNCDMTPIRFSFSKMNTLEEIDDAADIVIRLLNS